MLLRPLANVHDSLALEQHRCEKFVVIRCHRRPLSSRRRWLPAPVKSATRGSMALRLRHTLKDTTSSKTRSSWHGTVRGRDGGFEKSCVARASATDDPIVSLHDSLAISSRCKSLNAANETRGEPIFIELQLTGPQFPAATFATIPGSNSTCAISPDARCSTKNSARSVRAADAIGSRLKHVAFNSPQCQLS